MTIALYWPVMRFGFIYFDDPAYVTENIHVRNGFTSDNIAWVFSHPVSANWHPLTMLSHMVDCQLFGLKPAGHHLTSVLIHALNGMLVFLLLRRQTRAVWRSLLVAALFVVHPLRVESVAWVAERKDVLSAFLGLLSLWFYAGDVQKRSGVESQRTPEQVVPTLDARRVTLDYGLALLFLALGLMSKATLVTWPLVMLLLDYWPLKRFHAVGVWRLVREKIPFLVLAATASVVTYLVQKQGGAMVPDENLPIGTRFGNSLISYCRYLWKLFWPQNLVIVYPHPGYWPEGEVILAGGLVLGISVVLFLLQRRHPFGLMGWLWYCGTLVPMIGLVQVGDQAMADRYTYIPSIGLLILTVWGAHELARRGPRPVITASVTGVTALALCIGLTHRQLGYWRDSETLFRHAIAITGDNFRAQYVLGVILDDKGRLDEAMEHLEEAVRLRPFSVPAHNRLGIVLGRKKQIDEAIHEFREAIRLKPDSAEAHSNLGSALLAKGQLGEAMSQFQEAIRLAPDSAEAHYNLGLLLGGLGRNDEAIFQLQEAIRLQPDDPDAHYNLGIAYTIKGRIDEAIGQFREAIRLKPDYAQAHNNLGIILGRHGQIDKAIRQLQEAIRLNPDHPMARSNLAELWERTKAPTTP